MTSKANTKPSTPMTPQAAQRIQSVTAKANGGIAKRQFCGTSNE